MLPTYCIKELSLRATSPKKALDVYRQFSNYEPFALQNSRVSEAIENDQMCFFRLGDERKQLVEAARKLDAHDTARQKESRWRHCVGRNGREDVLKLPLVKLFPVEIWTDFLRAYSDARYGAGTQRQIDHVPSTHARGQELGVDGLRKDLRDYLDTMVDLECKQDERMVNTHRERTESPAALGRRYSSLLPDVYEQKMEMVKSYIVDSVIARREFHRENPGRSLQRFAPFVAATLHNLEAEIRNEVIADQIQQARYGQGGFSFGFGRR
jgi:hypothetical protein